MDTTHATHSGEAVTPARAYQEYFGPAIFEPLAAHTIRHAAPRPGEDALDLACGTGIVTRRLAEAVGPTGRVEGLDVNPGMLAEARTRTPVATGSAPVTYLEADVVATALPAGSYDLVTCQQGLQFFTDRLAGVRLARRVLRTGGRAVVVTWRGLDRHPLYRAMADAEVPHLAVLGVEVSRVDVEAPFSLGDPAELQELLLGGGFGSVTLGDARVEARFPDADHFVRRMEHAYAAVVPRFAADPAAFDSYLDGITKATEAIVAEHRRGDDVVVPMHALVAVATV